MNYLIIWILLPQDENEKTQFPSLFAGKGHATGWVCDFISSNQTQQYENVIWT